ncbi:hypothetical protein ACLMJK_009262 [Lecanora helva]
MYQPPSNHHASLMTTPSTEQDLRNEITRLQTALSTLHPPSPSPTTQPLSSHSHPLLLLSDSALPLGSFAFSSGLESHLCHHPNTPINLPHFLSLSLTSLASTTLPYLLAAHRNPRDLSTLDETLDACTLCPVARRASVAQGRALLTLWERAFRGEVGEGEARGALDGFVRRVKMMAVSARAQDDGDGDGDPEPSAHFPPIWGALTCALSIPLQSAAYTFLLNHAKAVCSAAVRAGVMGPYAAQGILASKWLQAEIEGVMREWWDVEVVDAGQGVPMLDLWVGRHELLYSRIFNS